MHSSRQSKQANARLWLLGASVLVATILAPSLAGILASDWLGSPKYDGRRYVLGWQNVVAQESRNTCGPAVLATLLLWQNRPVSKQAITEESELQEVGISLYEFARLAERHDLTGEWVRAARTNLATLPTPFVAHIVEPAGHFVIVRRIEQGYVYATDPAAGHVLYPLSNFLGVWTQRAFIFDDRPEMPS